MILQLAISKKLNHFLEPLKIKEKKVLLPLFIMIFSVFRPVWHFKNTSIYQFNNTPIQQFSMSIFYLKKNTNLL